LDILTCENSIVQQTKVEKTISILIVQPTKIENSKPNQHNRKQQVEPTKQKNDKSSQQQLGQQLDLGLSYSSFA